jgi:hypothetical protein
MLGFVSSFVSRFGSSKGMVTVPNFLGVANSTANTQVTSTGLRVSPGSGIRNTNVFSENGVILSQTPEAGTLVDYETEVVITSGNFIADTVVVGPCQNYGTTTNDPDYCSGNTYVYGSARTKRRKTVTTTNNVTSTTTTSFDNSCTDSVVSRGSAQINGQCGYVAPPVVCVATEYALTNWSSCVNGNQTRTMYKITSNCFVTNPIQSRCCRTSPLIVYGPWIKDTHSRVQSVTTTDTLCNVTVTYNTVCTTRTTTPICGKCYKSTSGSIIQKCTATRINSDCTTTPLVTYPKCT